MTTTPTIAAGRLVGALLASAAVAISAAPTASAAAPPFSDPSAVGSIGLCNRQGQAVTSGSLLDAPFVWTAVSSTPAPDGYAQGKATLFAFQPRQGVDPGQWSGSQLTGSSTFSNPAHPVVQATNGDEPLLPFTQAYPPRWDGLVQLRIYFSGVDVPVYSRTYPATVIRVSGQTWSVVSGASVACNSGHGTSDETQILGAAAVGSPQSVVFHPGTVPPTTAPPAPGSTPATTAVGTPTAGGSATTTGAPSPPSPTPPPRRLAAGRPTQPGSGAGGGAAAAAIAGALALVLVAGGLLVARRRGFRLPRQFSR